MNCKCPSVVSQFQGWDGFSQAPICGPNGLPHARPFSAKIPYTAVECRFAQPQMLINGPINVFPSLLKEYSTAMDFDFVTRLTINPADSRLRRFFVSTRCNTLPSRRRNWPWRCGPSLREAKILTVHLPMSWRSFSTRALVASSFLL